MNTIRQIFEVPEEGIWVAICVLLLLFIVPWFCFDVWQDIKKSRMVIPWIGRWSISFKPVIFADIIVLLLISQGVLILRLAGDLWLVPAVVFLVPAVIVFFFSHVVSIEMSVDVLEHGKKFKSVADILKMKWMYRQLVKKFHHDLATDEKDLANRLKMMKDINDAYAKGDIDTIQMFYKWFL